MKATLMVSEVMIAASLLAVTACGVVEPTSTAHPPMGGMEMPIPCDSASECTGGAACDASAHECVTDVLTLDPTDFVDDGLRWWSAASGPMLHGKYQGGAEAVVQVKVGAGAPVLAAIDGGRWTVQLAAGTFTGTDALVAVTLTDPSRGVVSLEQTIALDSAAPVIGLDASTVRDERGDLVDFATGVPVHDHQGDAIELGSAGCPVVYKYSYLMDAHAPAYGSELTQNPIAWAVTLQDARVASAEFRIRDPQGTVLRDWKPIAGTGTSYPVTLVRDGDAGIGDLAMKAGKYTVDVRARDWANLEANASYCIDFKPLAAPLQIAQASIASGADALSSWSLVANSPISRLTNSGVGAVAVEQRITQYSSEPVVVTLAASQPTGSWATRFLQGWIASENTKVTISCASMNCDLLAAPYAHNLAGTLTSISKTVELLDDNGASVPGSLGGYIIPGRAVGAPPAEYRVRVRVSNVTHYGSDQANVYGERTYGSLNYTGTAAGQSTQACSRVLNGVCQTLTQYQYIRGIDTIGLSLDPMTIQLGVAASIATSAAAPSHVAPATFIAPALSWNGGDENTL